MTEPDDATGGPGGEPDQQPGSHISPDEARAHGFDQPYTHQGSKHNLLGDAVNDAKLVADLSTAQRVSATTPPCFLVHTSADTVVPPENSIDFYLALRRAKVPAELHIVERGEHGFGLAPGDPVLGTWPEQLAGWLRGRRLLQKG